MKKIVKRVLLAGMLLFGAGLAACGGGSGGTTVTFRLNYKSGKADIFQTVKVEKGQCVEEPKTQPVRDKYIFDGWHEDSKKDSEFDFEEPIKKSIKVFAHWLARLECTFDYNYTGAPAAQKVEVIQKQPVVRPADPTRDGYQFIGWTINKETGEDGYDEYFDFATLFQKDLTLYAKWGAVGSAKAYRFEAEYCECITKGMGMTGNTYSGATNGKALIQEDTAAENVNASNGYFVHFLYAEGNNLEFDINSDSAGFAKITMRLSAEYREEGFCISPNGISTMNEYDEEHPTAPVRYTVKVNDVAVEYEAITFTDVPKQGEGWKAFNNYLLNASVPLQAGKNTIEMITDNLVKLYGTAVSTAPMIDCLTFETNCTLSWMNAKPSQVF